MLTRLIVQQERSHVISMIKIDDQNGITLVECLIVLFVLSLALLLVFPLFGDHAKHKEAQYALQLLEHDIYYAQQTAMVQSERVKIVFEPERKKYKLLYTESNEQILARTFPSNVSFQTNFRNNTLYINHLGHSSQAGTATFEYYHRGEQKETSFVFQLGSGRFRTSEQQTN